MFWEDLFAISVFDPQLKVKCCNQTTHTILCFQFFVAWALSNSNYIRSMNKTRESYYLLFRWNFLEPKNVCFSFHFWGFISSSWWNFFFLFLNKKMKNIFSFEIDVFVWSFPMIFFSLKNITVAKKNALLLCKSIKVTNFKWTSTFKKNMR